MNKIINIFLSSENGRISKKIVSYFKNNFVIRRYFKIVSYFKNNVCGIDFSSPTNTINILKRSSKAIIIGTTGFNQKQMEFILKRSSKDTVFLSYNFNINFFRFLVNSRCLQETQQITEIIDIHNKNKKDSPSGSSTILGNFLNCDVFRSYKIGDTNGIHTTKYVTSDNKFIMVHQNNNMRDMILGIIKSLIFISNKNSGIFSIGNILC